MIQLNFENQMPSFNATSKLFLPYLKRGVQVLSQQKKFKKSFEQGVIELILVDDKAIQKLNREHRGKDKSTDVLSFSYFGQEVFPENDTVGEIVISLPKAKKQAKEHNKTVNQELQFLFVHGFLHLFGYDHEELSERKRMFDLQDAILGTTSWRKIADAQALA